MRSKVECTGYPRQSTVIDQTQELQQTTPSRVNTVDAKSFTILPIISTIPWAEHEQRRLALLACTVLTRNPNKTQSPELTAAFQLLLPQLLQTLPFVHAAAAAFGTAYRDCVMSRSTSQGVQTSSKSHVQALHLVRREIGAAKVTDVVPVLLACVLLAAADNLQTRGKDSLSHILGALSMLYIAPSEQSETSSPQAKNSSPRHTDGQTSAKSDASKHYIIHEAFRWVDIEVTTFVRSSQSSQQWHSCTVLRLTKRTAIWEASIPSSHPNLLEDLVFGLH